MSLRLHASCVLWQGAGILIRGASGSGKSMLAWSILAEDGRLVADDYCDLTACHGRLVATPPAATEGLIELRGRGLVHLPHEQAAVIRLVIDLIPEAALERLPDAEDLTTEIAGIRLPRQPAPARSPATLLLVRTALAAALRPREGLAR
ncbi:HPr kinase/phosphorylase [Afifella sp. YEN Y35]|uniref:HPr kinase/phosphorylase n=1 Tax=Afifella sp. YEN Y35 TaxID=3388337 RepID=UPI0039DF87D2